MDKVCVTRGGSLEGMPVGGVALWGVALERTARRGLQAKRSFIGYTKKF